MTNLVLALLALFLLPRPASVLRQLPFADPAPYASLKAAPFISLVSRLVAFTFAGLLAGEVAFQM